MWCGKLMQSNVRVNRLRQPLTEPGYPTSLYRRTCLYLLHTSSPNALLSMRVGSFAKLIGGYYGTSVYLPLDPPKTYPEPPTGLAARFVQQLKS